MSNLLEGHRAGARDGRAGEATEAVRDEDGSEAASPDDGDPLPPCIGRDRRARGPLGAGPGWPAAGAVARRSAREEGAGAAGVRTARALRRGARARLREVRPARLG